VFRGCKNFCCYNSEIYKITVRNWGGHSVNTQNILRDLGKRRQDVVFNECYPGTGSCENLTTGWRETRRWVTPAVPHE
jgi:hypothetical protein